MVHATIDHQILTTPRFLVINDARNVNAAFTHDVSPEFDHDACAWHVWLDYGVEQDCQVSSNSGQVERLVPIEIWNAESAAEVDIADWRRNFGQLQNEIDGSALRGAEDFRTQVLGPRKNVKSEELDIRAHQRFQHG